MFCDLCLPVARVLLELSQSDREVMCNFWTETFGQTTDYCALASLPKYQLWDPPKSLPPGTPPLKVNV